MSRSSNISGLKVPFFGKIFLENHLIASKADEEQVLVILAKLIYNKKPNILIYPIVSFIISALFELISMQNFLETEKSYQKNVSIENSDECINKIKYIETSNDYIWILFDINNLFPNISCEDCIKIRNEMLFQSNFHTVSACWRYYFFVKIFSSIRTKKFAVN